ncbi:MULTISPECIES: response regulator transcription factor [Actinomyces]|uniref:Response regulator transcription factor n=1 Tax=Actinomyces marmotae TaxID=2737173 RepID=A0A6M8B2N7_9ACTO|nr:MULTISPECIES: response regulator transcription factor [Actinomyces]QKD78920.1 response regulator transcription factor [Actinomyces marmotae]
MPPSATDREIRIIVVDDDPIVRDAIASALRDAPGIEVVAMAENGADAVSIVHERTVDVVLMDVQMPVLDGVTATRRVREISPATSVLILTTFDDDTFLDGALAAGASGFLLKTTPPAELITAIRTIHEGGKVLSPGPTSRILDRYISGQPPKTNAAEELDLSEREKEVLELLCQARSNYQIARRLNVAETTVKTHVSAIMRKMKVASRLEIVVEAHRRGLSNGFS